MYIFSTVWVKGYLSSGNVQRFVKHFQIINVTKPQDFFKNKLKYLTLTMDYYFNYIHSHLTCVHFSQKWRNCWRMTMIRPIIYFIQYLSKYFIFWQDFSYSHNFSQRIWEGMRYRNICMITAWVDKDSCICSSNLAFGKTAWVDTETTKNILYVFAKRKKKLALFAT